MQDLPSASLEKAHYLKHNNSINNEGYVQFLNKAILPALPFLHMGMQGLDYGCGPGPVLSELLRNRGYEMDNYDPYFFPDLDDAKRYDFIFATECFEHFFSPAVEMRRLSHILKKDGYLVVMTQHWQNLSDLKTWYYAKDLTHVVFYHRQTFNWIANNFKFEIIFTDNIRAVILKKT
jgi:SAM-dependent methyltransferase